jgi:hypothetical protein
MPAKVKYKIADLLQFDEEIEIAPGKFLSIRPINLDEMVLLFTKYQEAFVALYNRTLTSESDAQVNLGPFLVAAPDLVAAIIAIASDSAAEPGAEELIRHKMAATVQLIALKRIWEISVPDPKKAKELLFEVTAQLRRLGENQQNGTAQPPSPTT